jgi:hypothetical protein
VLTLLRPAADLTLPRCVNAGFDVGLRLFSDLCPARVHLCLAAALQQRCGPADTHPALPHLSRTEMLPGTAIYSHLHTVGLLRRQTKKSDFRYRIF